ncbi:MAG TPA: MBL fold metallo-hydrolase [Bdellovibrionales bacterium]|nr:MAG: hypothetical protein A2X97_07600 [Bdellovibrionales bacterium GWA1_52_35]OFZ40322.1 MAG: hypothetical protein A2070_11615 [Bdellovibrionales bacterium GWC1_52_8]HAR42006.1 MBL fold metallo-hydrolase [Bdellovibrionales bacterium]HCM41363.1 MBL fold metallo-hydrolase [Bdellovibrionales bacterium]
MRLTILGCGTSTGVPLIHCSCPVCKSRNSKNKRLRASAWLQIHGKSFLLDTSTDFRAQALRTRIPRIDAVFYTHPHADHIHGIDDLRSFNFIQKESIPLYGNQWTCDEMREKFKYIFSPRPVEGGGIPQLTLNTITTASKSLKVSGVKVVPISLKHGSRETVGYRFESIAYLTDCSYIPISSIERLRGLEVLVLDCLRIEPHQTHLNLEQALGVIRELKPKRTYLTHLGHDFDYVKTSKALPKGVALAYDGLKISL